MKIDKEQLIKELTVVFRNVLESEEIELKETTNPSDVKDWDSVNHLILIHAIEEHYKIKFLLSEIINFRTAGDICISIMSKLA